MAQKVKINITNNNPSFQSPHTYLQAAGSDSSDGSARGIHLRWDFRRYLGDNHIPKGNLSGPSGTLAPSTAGFNRDNDFVNIYRTEFNDKPAIHVDLSTSPSATTETGPTRLWNYNNIVPIVQIPSNIVSVEIRFTDVAQYDTLRTTINPMGQSLDFIKAYTGIVEARVVGRLSFGIAFDINKKVKAGGFFKVENISLEETDDSNSVFISCRESYTAGVGNLNWMFCENVHYTRFQYSKSYPTKLHFLTYIDFILYKNLGERGDWENIGQFSLTQTDNVAYTALEDITLYPIDKKWPKFNEADAVSGAFKVKVQNYKDKWIPPAAPLNGLKEAVKQYIVRSAPLSPLNLTAEASIPADQTHNTPDSAHIDMSYLDMLKIVSLDYHAARMLGLGHIDGNPKGENTGKRAVYVMEYITTASIDGVATPQLITHLYMSLPTGLTDYRLPPAPVLDPVTYGLTADNGTGTPTSLTDVNGYTLFDDSRFINLHKQLFRYELPFEAFYATPDEFCLCEQTIPVAFGVEYRKDTDSSYRRPEIANDPNFKDHANINEVAPIPERAVDPFYVHQETEEGIHVYGSYSINWFSRPSPVSNLQNTDFTDFPKRNTLLPPAAFMVQLIQQEEPLIFTTSAEQIKLASLASPDKTLVRVTYDWHHIHNNAYQYADYIQFFFRQAAPLTVRGLIASVTQLPDHKVQVMTNSYLVTSASPAQTVQPFIDPLHIGRFSSGLISIGENTFVIDSVVSGGATPVLILQQVRQTASSDPLNNNQFITTETWLSPAVGEMFMAVENLSDTASWDATLARKVYVEKFHTNVTVQLFGSTNNDGVYTLDSVQLVSGNTELFVKEEIPSATPVDGSIEFKKQVRIVSVNSGTQTFTLQGNLVSELPGSTTFDVFAGGEPETQYTVNTAVFNGTDTDVTVIETISATLTFGYAKYNKVASITGINTSARNFTIAGDFTSEINAPYHEIRTEDDGSLHDIILGGLSGNATITDVPDKDSNGNNIPGSKTGVYNITFNSLELPPHIDPSVEWYKGVVRISEDPAFLPNPVDPLRSTPEPKTLQVWEIKKDVNGIPLSPLQLIVFDGSADYNSSYVPQGDFVPIKTGPNVSVNFHPSYRLYLLAETSVFDEPNMLPAQGQGSRKTFMAARSSDSAEGLYSFMTTPAVILAQEIVPPLPPGPPTGPLFATRPDFYGKSTYTFDVTVNPLAGHVPYSFVFYRSDENLILRRLYKSTTADQIAADLADMQSPDADYMQDRWSDFVNGMVDSGGLFKEYISGGYRFPNPDNDQYLLPDPKLNATPQFPFATPQAPGANVVFTLSDGVTQINMIDVVKQAIESAFLPMTEQPLIYQYIASGTETSNKKPVLRDSSGNLLPASNPAFDPSPMAVKFVDGTDTKVRFTDYTLDGASKSIYFYYGLEMSNKLQISERSAIAGPIRLVNSFPPEAPGIKKITAQLPNLLLGTSAAVVFEMNDYIEDETITKLQIWRTTSPDDELSVRTMKLAKTVNIGDPIVDDFTDVDFPPYGDPLFYRLVALREITNESGNAEWIPSRASSPILTNIVDNINPPAPALSYISDPPTTTSPITLNNVVLNWAPTCYNGRYYLYKQNSSGNWTKIYSVVSNDDVISVELLITDLLSGSLQKQDANGNTIYHRFRVQVENSSGLLNISNNELTI